MNFIRSIWTHRLCYNRFKLPVLFLLMAEIFVITAWTASTRLRYHAQKGFLVKSGKQYIVFWIDDERQQSMRALQNLAAAITFARSDLGLEIATDTLNYFPIESIWMKKNLDSYYLYWKPIETGYLNRLTFNSLDEAEKFKDGFRRGAYSPSPIGHSLALKPIKKN